MSHTKEKVAMLEYYTVWCEDTGRFEDISLIYFANEKGELVEIARTNPILPHDEQVANARRICQCVNGWDKLTEELADYKEGCEGLKLAIQDLRPPAECYRHVCGSLGIEKDILGYIKTITEQRDKLLEACEVFVDEVFTEDVLKILEASIGDKFSIWLCGIIQKTEAAIAAAKENDNED